MMLLLDFGHTCAKFAVYKAEKISPVEVVDIDHLMPKLPKLLKTYNLGIDTLVGVCEWHGENGQWLRTQIQECWDGDVRWVDSAMARGNIRLHYKEPNTFGADRLLALHAARKLTAGGPCIVVDVGTAVTVDALTSAERHIGGWIFPGPTELASCMLSITPCELEDQKQIWQREFISTGQAVEGGIFATLSAGVDEMCEECQRALDECGENESQIFITGGHAEEMLMWCASDMQWAPNLVLEGLAEVADRF